MAMGRPILTCDAPGCRETVEPGVNGLRVPVGGMEELAEAMVGLGSEAPIRTAMGAESARLARERFNAAGVDRRVLGLLQVEHRPRSA